jgi:hypothetical protein
MSFHPSSKQQPQDCPIPNLVFLKGGGDPYYTIDEGPLGGEGRGKFIVPCPMLQNTDTSGNWGRRLLPVMFSHPRPDFSREAFLEHSQSYLKLQAEIQAKSK